MSDATGATGEAINAASRRVHPWVFLVLYIPFGVVPGYVSVTLAYQLKQAGATVGQVAALSALALLPHTWKFFWAPVVDSTLSQKKWYVLSALFTAGGLAATGFFPATPAGLSALSKIVFLTGLSTTFLGMAIESLLAYCAPEDKKGNASGWFQAGNLGGSGIGGGLALVLAEQYHAPAVASCAVGLLCLLCAMALVALPTPPRMARKPGFVSGAVTPLKDLWEVVRHRAGLLALILCFLPVGSGAAPFAAIADEWHASADTVALVTGLFSGLISAVGCLLGGWACDRMDRKKAYVWFGILQGASAVAMALLPRNQPMYIVWALVYTFTQGLSYAAFSAFVLEAIGKGAAATKYNALAALSNIPIYYMTTLDGWTHDRWGSAKMLFIEAGLAMASAVFFALLAKFLLGPKPQTQLL
jgi:MFS family permease